jgi:curved DNA-binding protein CbpA/CheY-like chemotaxis protein
MKIFKKLFDGVGSSSTPARDRVLLVESNEQDAALCFATLSKANFDVRRVTSCADSFKLLRSGANFQAIVSNFYLSDGTAVQILKYAKEHSPDTITIVVAPEIEESLILEAINAGASYCIPKVDSYGDNLPQLIKLSREQHIGFKTMADTGVPATRSGAFKPVPTTGELRSTGYKGQLTSITIPRLLRAFYQQQSTGALHIKRDEEITSLYFIDGAIVFAGSSSAENRLGEWMVSRGRISRDDYGTACKLMATSGLRFGTALTTLGIIKLEDLKPLVVQHVLRLIYSTFDWDSGDFVFESGIKLENEVMLSLSTADVIFAGIRHLGHRELIDKWLGDCDRILIQTSDPFALFQALTLHPDEAAVIEKIDKPMSVNQVRSISELNEDVVSRTLCGLIETGMLVPFETREERLVIEMPKFSELFDDAAPMPLDFDARAAAEFCYEVETTLRRFQAGDHYTVLGIQRNATVEQITNSFRGLAKKFHPDRHSQMASYNLNLKTDLKAIFERIAEAYYTLSDQDRRFSYDQSLNKDSVPARPSSLGNLSSQSGSSLNTNPLANLRLAPFPKQSGGQGTRPLPQIIPGLPGSDEYQVALEYYSRRDYDQARKVLLQAIDADPDNAEYRIAFARSLMKIPLYIRQAEDAYLKAIELDPNNADYYAELGLLYQQFSQIGQARKMLQRALELDPINPIALRAKI